MERLWRTAVAVAVLTLLSAHPQRATSSVASASPEIWEQFFAHTQRCADDPVAGLLYQNSKAARPSRLPTIWVEGKWLSAAPSRLDDVTVCTHADLGRLHMLQDLCEAWSGPMSIAVHLPLDLLSDAEAELEAALKRLSKLHAQLDVTKCALDMVLVTERLPKDALWSYPSNVLRNQAMARAHTKLVAILDVDLLPRTGMREMLLAQWDEISHNALVEGDVFVVPAFEPAVELSESEGLALAADAAAGSKETVRSLWNAQRLVQCSSAYQAGHRATEYERWFRIRQTYPVNYELGFEPFVVASRLHLPWFDERLRDYNWDRAAHSHSLARSGLSLVVLPNAWLVHRPHPPSAAYNLTLEVAKLMRLQETRAGEKKELASQDRGGRLAQTFARHVTLAKEALQEVEEGRYPAFGVSSLAGCRRLDLFFEGGKGGGAQELQAALDGLPREDKLPLLKQQLEQPVVTWW